MAATAPSATRLRFNPARRRWRWVGLFVLILATPSCSAPADTGDVVMAGLDELPSLQAMKTHYPEDFRRLEGGVREAVLRNAPDDVRRAVQGTLGAVVARQMAKADVETSAVVYEATRAQGEALRKVDPAACAAFMDGRGLAAEFAEAFDEDLRMRDAQAVARLLRQTATEPAPPSQPMSFDELLKLSSDALDTMAGADQDVAMQVLREERDPATPEEARAMCDFNLALADTILSRPRPIAGAMIRRLWAME